MLHGVQIPDMHRRIIDPGNIWHAAGFAHLRNQRGKINRQNRPVRPVFYFILELFQKYIVVFPIRKLVRIRLI